MQKQISTGYRVATRPMTAPPTRWPSGVRSDVGALTTANQQLGNVQGLLSTTVSALNRRVQHAVSSARDVLVDLAIERRQGTERRRTSRSTSR